jgi:hypothetical protein
VSEQIIRDGDLVLVGSCLDGIDPYLLDLGAKYPSEPWSERCEGCDGSGITHAGERLVGPCSSCWGLGRVVFAFHADELGASVVPAVVGTPWLFDRSAKDALDLRCSCVASERDADGNRDPVPTGECAVHG